MRVRALALGFWMAFCGLAFGNSLYVSDASLFTVQVFDATTGSLTGSLTPTGGWGTPTGIAVASDGTVYVADSWNNVIDRFDSLGNFLGVFASSGLFEPTGLAFGPDGFLYVANYGPDGSGYITRYDSSGNPVDPTPFVPSSTGLSYPGGLAFGPNGNLYISDSGNSAIDEVILPTGTLSTLVGPGCPATPFSNPSGVAFGPDGNLYVADEGAGCGAVGSGVYQYGADGSLLGAFIAPNTLSSPIDLAFGPGGNLFVTDSVGGVTEFNQTTGAELADFAPIGGTLINPQYLAFSTPVPEPATLALIGIGLAGLTCLRRRRR